MELKWRLGDSCSLWFDADWKSVMAIWVGIPLIGQFIITEQSEHFRLHFFLPLAVVNTYGNQRNCRSHQYATSVTPTGALKLIDSNNSNDLHIKNSTGAQSNQIEMPMDAVVRRSPFDIRFSIRSAIRQQGIRNGSTSASVVYVCVCVCYVHFERKLSAWI